jgi:hypothetical protein
MTEPTETLDLDAIEARINATTVTPEPIELATTWDVSPGIFGKTRHMLSAANNDDNVILMVEMKSAFGYWHVSPPGFDDCDYAHGTIAFADFGGFEGALAECKRLMMEAWERWCSNPSERECEDPVGIAVLNEHALEDLRALLAEVRRLTAA